MDPPASHRSRRTTKRSELYSTVVIHSDSDSDSNNNPDDRNLPRRRRPPSEGQDLYATMVYKDVDKGREDEDDDDASLPPLLKRLPKDFGGGAPIDYDDDDAFDFDHDTEDFGTMIVKTDRNRPRNRSVSSSSASTKPRSSPLPFVNFQPGSPGKRAGGRGGSEEGDESEEDEGDGYSTFVVRSTMRSRNRESISGTVVRRTSGSRSDTRDGGEGLEGSTLGRAVASMQGMGELGFGKQRKGNGSPMSEEGCGRIRSKVSSSSIPESIYREDPNSKYELLNELGKLLLTLLNMKFVVNEIHSYDMNGGGFKLLSFSFMEISGALKSASSKITPVINSGDVGDLWLMLIVLQEKVPMGLYIKRGILKRLSWLLSKSFLCVKGYGI